jgi:hypothetical protein
LRKGDIPLKIDFNVGPPTVGVAVDKSRSAGTGTLRVDEDVGGDAGGLDFAEDFVDFFDTGCVGGDRYDIGVGEFASDFVLDCFQCFLATTTDYDVGGTHLSERKGDGFADARSAAEDEDRLPLGGVLQRSLEVDVWVDVSVRRFCNLWVGHVVMIASVGEKFGLVRKRRVRVLRNLILSWQL